MVPDSLIAQAEDVVKLLSLKGLSVCLLESGTGGLASAVLTTIPGSSQVFDRGLVVYSNESKQEMLEVSRETLEKKGAVSRPAALEMCEAGLKISSADLVLSETFIAGPGGGSEEKPVGSGFLCLCRREGQGEVRSFRFKGDRRSVRVQIVQAMLDWLEEVLDE